MAVAESVPRRFRHRRRMSSYLLIAAVVAAWTAVLFAVPHVSTGAAVRPFALFVHLASLVLGFGAVLTLDWFGLRWMAGRQELIDLVRVAQVVHLPIWAGLAGLTLSGVLLSPDTSAPLTVVKMVAVLAVALNGLAAPRVQQRLLALEGRKVPRRTLALAVLVATVSQVGWWTATLVGFLNAQQ